MSGPEAGVSLAVKINDEASSEITRLALQLTPGKLRLALDEIGAANVTETQRRFETESDPDGGRWRDYADLADITKAQRRQPDPKILRDGGDLYDSVTHTVGLLETTVGTNRVQARIHQLGGQAGRNKSVTIPARPYLGVSSEGEVEIIEILTEHVEGK